MTAWYAVNTLPHQETRAETNLLRQGFSAWLPSILKLRRRGKREEAVREAFFPGYLFVSLDVEQDRWSPINSTYGVRRLICQANRPLAVPKRFMEGLRSQVDEGSGCITVPEPHFEPGQTVRLLSGPFADSIGTLLRLNGRDRVTLLLSVLGGEIATTVSKTMIAAA